MKIYKVAAVFLTFFCLLQGCGQRSEQNQNIDYITKTSGEVDFGKTDPSAYTPEIRANMKMLYEDKFGLFVHFGPYAQLEGVWDGTFLDGNFHSTDIFYGSGIKVEEDRLILVMLS